MIISAFNDIENKGLPQATGIAGQLNLDNILSMQVGSGSNVLRGDQSGLWLGAEKFIDASFRVDMEGNVYITSASIILNDENNIPAIIISSFGNA
jgi:hypothetical protein